MRGVSAGQIVRDQPGVKEQVGVYLDESVDLAVALHARPRPLRRRPRRGAARPPGHALRLRLAVGHRALHHATSPSSASRSASREVGGQHDRRRQPGRRRSSSAFNLPLGDTAALRVVGLLQPHRRLHRRRAARPQRQRGRQRRQPDRRARRGQVRARTSASPSRRASSTSAWRRTAGTASTPTTSWPIRSPPRGPAVTLGDARAVHAARGALHGRLHARPTSTSRYDFGNAELTSITSYTDRDVLVVRDATALTASITGGSIGLPPSIYTLDAPLNDATTAKVLDGGAAPGRRQEPLPLGGGRLLQRQQARLRPEPARQPASRTCPESPPRACARRRTSSSSPTCTTS